jgi:hypothetical protein
MFVPDSGSEFFHPGSRVKNIPDPVFGSESKNFSDPGCSSRIRIPGPNLDFLPITDPGSRGVRKAPDPGSGSATLFDEIAYNVKIIYR